jgi:murein DD-endopeptidase MepM/ murein hydrolase activator NlpD
MADIPPPQKRDSLKNKLSFSPPRKPWVERPSSIPTPEEDQLLDAASTIPSEPEFNQDADQIDDSDDSNQSNSYDQRQPKDKDKDKDKEQPKDKEKSAAKDEAKQAAKTVEKDMAQGAEKTAARAAGAVAKEAALAAGRAVVSFVATNPIFWAIFLAAIVILGISLAFVLTFACTPDPTTKVSQLCGSVTGTKLNIETSEDRSLAQQLTLLATGQIDPALLLKTLALAESEINFHLQSANDPGNKNAAQIKDLSAKGLTIIKTLRASLAPPTTSYLPKYNLGLVGSAEAVAQPNPAASPEQLSAQVKELAGILDQLNTFDASFILGNTSWPLYKKDMTGGFDVHPHGSTFQHPQFEYHHNAYKTGNDPIDIIVKEEGAQVRSPFDGVVESVASVGTRDERVIILSSNKRGRTWLCHVNASVKAGQQVKAGQVVATVKTVGFPHLHFELRIDDKNWNNDPTYSSGQANWDKMKQLLREIP